MCRIINLVKTGNKIKELMKTNNLTPVDIQEYLSLSCVQSVYRWINGKSLPTVDNLFALSCLFNVTMDEIVQSDFCNRSVIIKEPVVSYFIGNN